MGCDQWTTAELQEFMGHIAPHRSKELMEIYEEANDKRLPYLTTIFEHMNHWNLLPHHVWTDPRTGHIVRAWQPFNGLQVYNPDSWKEGIEDETVFEYPPAMCKGPAAGQNETIWRINCDDDGNFNGTPPQPEGLGHAISEQWKQMAEAHKLKSVVV